MERLMMRVNVRQIAISNARVYYHAMSWGLLNEVCKEVVKLTLNRFRYSCIFALMANNGSSTLFGKTCKARASSSTLTTYCFMATRTKALALLFGFILI